MYVEKRIGGDYYQYVISITTYNPEQAAIRTLKWLSLIHIFQFFATSSIDALVHSVESSLSPKGNEDVYKRQGF